MSTTYYKATLNGAEVPCGGHRIMGGIGASAHDSESEALASLVSRLETMPWCVLEVRENDDGSLVCAEVQSGQVGGPLMLDLLQARLDGDAS